MSLYSLIVENKYILEIFYALIISSVCMLIVLKTDRFYQLSLHRGIRYFRNAFFFYGLAFGARYLFGLFSDFSLHYAFVLGMVFEYFFVMAGFFLFYSLIYKKVESPREHYKSSLLNPKIFVFHMVALIIAVLGYLWQTYYFMFVSQILIFFCSLIIVFSNYIKSGRQHKFLKFYTIAVLLGLGAWILNLLAALYFEWSKIVMMNVGILNIIFFLLFLFGVIKVTRG
ncbi:hypothetical protein M0R19_06470 [Candidatus Pacearchaeota archaeon]|nr:hypothetical protein [Candidatus Pacearchaeota archaeon]